MTVELNIAAGIMAVLLLGCALYGRHKWRGTMLSAPLVWVALSAACLALSAFMQLRGTESLSRSVLRFVVAVSTLTPLVAVLGAKRPQDKGWQWIVLSLWVIVVWPVLQTLANPAGPRVEIFAAWKLFLVGLIAMGPLNYLATRHGFASLLVAVGQLMLFAEFLEIGELTKWQLPVAVGCFLVAAVLVALRKPSAAQALLPAHALRWLVLRDAFGAFWGLRIMQRVNETAALRNWPMQLTWTGFEKVKDEEATAAHEAEIDQALDTLLRRFF
jgi:hypothetical protein